MAGWLSRLFRGDQGPDVTRARLHAERSLMALEGVVSVGTGLVDDGTEAIVVGVADETCAVAQAMPAQVDGVPVVVQQVGELSSEASIDESAQAPKEDVP
jgi:hypothetical protein